MYQPGIDIVVVNYHTPDDLTRFIASYVKHPPAVPASLYIVNNDCVEGCEDDFVVRQLLESIPGDVFYLPFEENLFYSGAANRAGSMGQREVLSIFNADTRFFDGTLNGCYETLLSEPKWGALGPLQVGDQGQVTHGGIFGTPDKPDHRGWNRRPNKELMDIRDDAVSISGSAYFTKREAWDEMAACPIFRSRYPEAEGAFLPTPHYYEETWYSYHLRAHGWNLVYTGQSYMFHAWHKSSPKGGWADKQMPISQKMFREMCDIHDIVRD